MINKKSFIILVLLLMATLFASAQQNILFLLPIDADKVNNSSIENINTQQDIENIFGKTLIHFWQGAQVAISELGDEGYDFNIIVRDITDASSLDAALKEFANQRIELIIAPVYGKLFPTVAEYGRKNKIPVVNPFSSRHDIIVGNPYIYKAYPSLSSRPAYISSHFPNANIILWTSAQHATHDAQAYEEYFTSRNIPFHKVTDSTFFGNKLSATKDNVVIACFNHPSSFTKGVHQALTSTSLPSYTWVIPEEWVETEEFNIENMNGLNVAYFANYFVDEADVNSRLFTYKYGEHFHSLPTIDNYAYQGYDITKFFLTMIANNYAIPTTQTLSYKFQFKRVEKGGYENVKARFIRLQDYEFKEEK